MPSKYEPLAEHFRDKKDRFVILQLAEIESLLGVPLPPCARRHRSWWANHDGPWRPARAWMSMGYEVGNVDWTGGWITFVRVD